MPIFWLVFYFSLILLNVLNGDVPQLDGRIVGGKNASIYSFPYQVSIRVYNNHVCGGSVFHTNYILTAAHCMQREVHVYTIKAGSDHLQSGGQIFKVCAIKNHEQWNLETMENDISILKLCEVLTFRKEILPVSLPDQNEFIKDGTLTIVSGWGYKNVNGSVSLPLQQVQVPIIPKRECERLYGDAIGDKMICAGYINKGGKDACQGDSGGPLLANGKLFGIVSWGFGCAYPDFPGVYTNIAKYRAWIKAITKY